LHCVGLAAAPKKTVRKRLFELHLWAGRRLRYSILAAARRSFIVSPKYSKSVLLNHSSAPHSVELFSVFNARSIVGKVSLIHDIMHDDKLDVFAVTETWVSDQTPEAIRAGVAPEGFIVHHEHRHVKVKNSSRKGGGVGGGISIIARSNILLKEFQP